MRIYVYAIAKDEARFVSRWVASMREADGIFVLDTGSRDGTPELLRREGCEVTERSIEPWRFDTARNESMALVPSDAELLVCTDLDEVFRAGWREALERDWERGARFGRYEYVWSFRVDGSDGVKFYGEKIHAPQGCRWTHPVHEVLAYDGEARGCFLPDVRLEHYPDGEKSRSSYLPLLELSVAEDPQDDRNMHYLGREYMFRGRWQEAIDTLERHLALPRARWDAERAASMRFIARCEQRLGHDERAELWLLRAALEAPAYREAWVALGELCYRQKRWRDCAAHLRRALDIKRRPLSYISELESWGALPWDLISIAWWELGEKNYARNCAREALRLAPTDERIRNNLEIMSTD